MLQNSSRWIMIALALLLVVLAVWLSWALDRIELAVTEKKASVKTSLARATAPVPTDMVCLSPLEWQGSRRFIRPASDEEAFAQGPFEKENPAGAGGDNPGADLSRPPSIPATSSSNAVLLLMLEGTNALHAFDERRAERCFRTAAVEDPQCAGAWLGLAVASEKLPGRAGYFLDKAEAATGKGAMEQAWITAYRVFFSTAEAGEFTERMARLAEALEAIAGTPVADPVPQIFALRYRVLAHHLAGSALPDPAATEALLHSLAAPLGVQQVSHYGVLLWMKLDARKALAHAQKLSPRGPVTRRLAAAPRIAIGQWDHALELLAASVPEAGNDPQDFQNASLLVRTLFHHGDTATALKLVESLAKLPRRPYFTSENAADADPGDAFVELRRLHAQMLMAAGRWDELSRSDPMTTLDEGGCMLARAHTHYWRAVAYAAQGFDQNARNQCQELHKIAHGFEENPALQRHRDLTESTVRGADAFLELAKGHVSAYVGEITDVPPAVLAPFLVKAGNKEMALALLETEHKSWPASVPVTAMMEAIKSDKPAPPPGTETAAASEAMAPQLPEITPMASPGFALPDTTGATVGREKWEKQPLLLIFQAGGSKVDDATPLKALRNAAPSFAHFGIPIAVISTEEASMLLEALELTGTPSPNLPFVMLSDTGQDTFRAWGCHDAHANKPLHGAFLIDAQDRILWSSVGYKTCVQPDYLLLECQRLLALWKPAVAAQ